jgi:hypothetical protein
LAIRSKCCVSILEPAEGTLVRHAEIKRSARINDARSIKKKCPALAQDEVFGMPEKVNVEPAAEKQKYKFSVWHWTLNSRSDFSQMTTEQKHQFKNLVDFIFVEENIDKYLVDRTLPDDPRKNLAEVKSEYYYEVGDTQHRLHVHGAIKLQHTGNYRLSNEKISGVVEKILG